MPLIRSGKPPRRGRALIPAARGPIPGKSAVFALLVAAAWVAPAAGQMATQDTARPPLTLPPVVDPSQTAEPVGDSAAGARAMEGGPSDPAELEAWLDGYLKSAMDENHVAGATVAVVKDGEVFLSKGYGFADEAARRPVDPATTLFRIGSVSKLFVWTSVMQLVERGLVELDQDVNAYLEDIEIPQAYGAPVTLEHLLTHAAGFEDHVIGLFGRSEEDLRPIGQVLAEQLPARVRPPGEVSSYSNHGTGLAMHVVETVTGVPWERYIQENVLDPLGMEHTTFAQPVPERLADDLSLGYDWQGGGFTEQPFEWVPLAPVGAASASAHDMATFMLVHLQLGEHGGRRILEESTALEMQSVLLRHAPGVNAMLHGFAELSRNGEWIIGHGGDTFWFHTQFAILPDRGLGIFISTNSAGGNPGAVVDAFIDRYFPVDDVAPTPPDDVAERFDQVTGIYRANRFSRTDPTKLSALVNTVRVRDGGDGTLRMSGTGTARWLEVAPLTFRQEHEPSTIAFRRVGDGRATHLFLGAVPYMALERVPASEHPMLHLALAAFAGAAFLLTVILWPLAGFFRIRYRTEDDESRLTRLTRFYAWAASLLFLLALVGFVVVVSDPNDVAMGDTGALRLVLWLPVVGGVMALGAVLSLFRAWYGRSGTMLGRLSYCVVVVAFVTFLWQLHTFNLLGWKL